MADGTDAGRTISRADQQLIDALRKRYGDALAASQNAEVLAERKRQTAALKELAREALEELPKLRTARETSLEELKAAREKVRALEAKVNPYVSVVASFAYDARRDEICAELRRTASPLIAVFIAAMRDEDYRTRHAAVETAGSEGRNPVTGRPFSNVRPGQLRDWRVG